ncbi:MAG: ATP synthase subunit I [Desulfobacteraceae bacterium]|nr:ATP synthase subunit I [Desulfobacteraceae bacterium]
MEITKRLIDFVSKSNWFLFVFLTLFSLINTSFKFTLGVMLGALIAAISFHLLKRTVNKAFEHPEKVAQQGRMILISVLIKYYIRFAISGLIIFLLIAGGVVNPLGLLAGLSVVVVSISIATILELTRLIFKEAI